MQCECHSIVVFALDRINHHHIRATTLDEFIEELEIFTACCDFSLARGMSGPDADFRLNLIGSSVEIAMPGDQDFFSDLAHVCFSGNLNRANGWFNGGGMGEEGSIFIQKAEQLNADRKSVQSYEGQRQRWDAKQRSLHSENGIAC